MAPRTLIPHIPFFISISSLTSHHCFKITTQLIHRDSYLSPLYNASSTVADRARRIVASSLARRAYLSADDDTRPQDGIGGIEAKLVWGAKYNIFYVKFSIGQPPVQQLALLDTGSDLLWLKCPPCTPCSVDSGAIGPKYPFGPLGLLLGHQGRGLADHTT